MSVPGSTDVTIRFDRSEARAWRRDLRNLGDAVNDLWHAVQGVQTILRAGSTTPAEVTQVTAIAALMEARLEGLAGREVGSADLLAYRLTVDDDTMAEEEAA